jgi:hypothetical protein
VHDARLTRQECSWSLPHSQEAHLGRSSPSAARFPSLSIAGDEQVAALCLYEDAANSSSSPMSVRAATTDSHTGVTACLSTTLPGVEAPKSGTDCNPPRPPPLEMTTIQLASPGRDLALSSEPPPHNRLGPALSTLTEVLMGSDQDWWTMNTVSTACRLRR